MPSGAIARATSRIAYSANTGKVVWRYWDPSRAPADRDTVLRLRELAAAGNPAGDHGPDGTMVWRLPEYVSGPEDTEERDAIERYRETVETFAGRFLLGAQWGASAVH